MIVLIYQHDKNNTVGIWILASLILEWSQVFDNPMVVYYNGYLNTRLFSLLNRSVSSIHLLFLLRPPTKQCTRDVIKTEFLYFISFGGNCGGGGGWSRAKFFWGLVAMRPQFGQKRWRRQSFYVEIATSLFNNLISE